MSPPPTHLLFPTPSLSTPLQIQQIANLDTPPLARLAEKVTKEYKANDEEAEDADDEASPDDNAVEPDDDDEPPQTCCLISLSTLHALTDWAKADPDRSLGLIIAMAQTASSSTENVLRNYPVPYFLYGTLSDPGFLADKLGVEDVPVVRGGKVWGWGVRRWGQYGAIVRAGEGQGVEGVVFVVRGEGEVERMAA